MRLRGEAVPTVVSIDALIGDVLLRTLEPAIASVERLLDIGRSVQDDRGEPDGFDGLDRRGSLERLLPSEWLLASEAPDEFIRRFEYRELGYLRQRTALDRRPQTALVLFDTGPDQLGRPRVAQLAALVVLARRAATAGAELRWGSLQHPARHSAARRDVFELFLAARTFRPPIDLPLDAFVDDCLVISPMPGPPYPARQLVLVDSGDFVAAELVDRRSGTRQRSRIPMPSPEDGVRLLRHPTGPPRLPGGAPTRERPPISNLVFDQAGNKLLARVEPHRLAVYPVPNSSQDKPGRTRYLETVAREGVIAAAGRVKKSVFIVKVIDDGHAVNVQRYGGNVTGLRGIGTFPLQGGPVAMPTADTRLGRLALEDGRLQVDLVDRRLTEVNGAYRISLSDNTYRWGAPGFELTAKATSGGWMVTGTEEWLYRGDGAVFGVFARNTWLGGTGRQEVRILVLEEGGRTIAAVGPHNEREQLYHAGEHITDAVAHHRSTTYALRTASGRIVVRSWQFESTLLEMNP